MVIWQCQAKDLKLKNRFFQQDFRDLEIHSKVLRHNLTQLFRGEVGRKIARG